VTLQSFRRYVGSPDIVFLLVVEKPIHDQTINETVVAREDRIRHGPHVSTVAVFR